MSLGEWRPVWGWWREESGLEAERDSIQSPSRGFIMTRGEGFLQSAGQGETPLEGSIELSPNRERKAMI